MNPPFVVILLHQSFFDKLYDYRNICTDSLYLEQGSLYVCVRFYSLTKSTGLQYQSHILSIDREHQAE